MQDLRDFYAHQELEAQEQPRDGRLRAEHLADDS